jgi:Fe2+ transport system protein FeoA
MNGYAGSLKWWGNVVNLLAVDSRQHPANSPQPPARSPSGQAQPASPHKPAVAPHETLAGQPVGRKLKIVGFSLAPDIYQRLLEMGLTKGTACTVVRYAPMGDPIELKVRGYSLSLRLAEAAGVQVSCL